MDEKTEQLRDLFLEATGADTVTEGQTESPGSLVDRDDAAVSDRLRELIGVMRERYEFSTDLDDKAYELVCRAHLTDAAADDAIAETITDALRTTRKPSGDNVDEGDEADDGDEDDETDDGDEGDETDDGDDDDETNSEDDGDEDHDHAITEATIRDARLDLHLVTSADRNAPFEYDRLKRLLAEDRSLTACASELAVDVATLQPYVDVVRADAASTRANDRFRDEFRALLTDAEIEGSFARDAREDGLRDATEDIETDVSL